MDTAKRSRRAGPAAELDDVDQRRFVAGAIFVDFTLRAGDIVAEQVGERMIGEVQRLGVQRIVADGDEVAARFAGRVRLGCATLRRAGRASAQPRKQMRESHIHRVTYGRG